MGLFELIVGFLAGVGLLALVALTVAGISEWREGRASGAWEPDWDTRGEDLDAVALAQAHAEALEEENEWFMMTPEALELEPRFEAAVDALANEHTPVSEVIDLARHPDGWAASMALVALERRDDVPDDWVDSAIRAPPAPLQLRGRSAERETVRVTVAPRAPDRSRRAPGSQTKRGSRSPPFPRRTSSSGATGQGRPRSSGTRPADTGRATSSRCSPASSTSTELAEEEALAERVVRVERELGAARPVGRALDLGHRGRPRHVGIGDDAARELGADDRRWRSVAPRASPPRRPAARAAQTSPSRMASGRPRRRRRRSRSAA